jgi:hypothetical protein
VTIQTDSQQFDAWLSRTDSVILVCWVTGHWWPGQLIGEVTQSRSQYIIDSYCQRGCGVKRRSFIARRNGLIDGNNAYDYPNSYSPGITGLAMDKFMRGLIRLELNKRRNEDSTTE